jgi:putative cell wall-binding protein
VSAAAPAAVAGDPVLLTGRDAVPQTTLDALAAGGITDVVIVGGPAAISQGVEQQVAATGVDVTRFAGTDRFATSAIVAGQDDAARVLVASTGRDWPDALAAAAAAAAWDAIVVLVDGQDLDASPATRDLVTARAFDRLVVSGQQAAIGDPVFARLSQLADEGSIPG